MQLAVSNQRMTQSALGLPSVPDCFAPSDRSIVTDELACIYLARRVDIHGAA